MITKLYHDLSILVPFFLFLTEVFERKHYHSIENGAVEHGLGPEGHKEEQLGFQVYLTSK